MEMWCIERKVNHWTRFFSEMAEEYFHHQEFSVMKLTHYDFELLAMMVVLAWRPTHWSQAALAIGYLGLRPRRESPAPEVAVWVTAAASGSSDAATLFKLVFRKWTSLGCTLATVSPRDFALVGTCKEKSFPTEQSLTLTSACSRNVFCAWMSEGIHESPHKIRNQSPGGPYALYEQQSCLTPAVCVNAYLWACVHTRVHGYHIVSLEPLDHLDSCVWGEGILCNGPGEEDTFGGSDVVGSERKRPWQQLEFECFHRDQHPEVSAPHSAHSRREGQTGQFWLLSQQTVT